jgi:PAP2 superfamily C-terminal
MTFVTPTSGGPVRSEPARQRRAVQTVIRTLVIAAGLVLWFWTQSLISQRGFPAGIIGDNLHALTAPLNSYLLHHARLTNALLIVSSSFIDLFAIFLLIRAITGPTIRPFLGLFLLFALRQLCEALTALPQPENMIWHYPGFPSLLVTYGVSNDFFFSGHTSVAVYGTFEISRLRKKWLTFAAILITIFEIATVLTLRAHYTMDVFAAAATALLIGIIAERFAPPLDESLSRFAMKFR